MFPMLSSDIDECTLRKQDPKYEDLYPCRQGVCNNTPGNYSCICKRGTRPDGIKFGCRSLLSSDQKLVIGTHHLFKQLTPFHTAIAFGGRARWRPPNANFKILENS